MKYSETTTAQWRMLEKRAAEGKSAKPIEERPDLDEWETYIWQCFWKIRHGVPSSGFGGINGISYSDLDAWVRVENPAFLSMNDRLATIDVLFLLDKEYMAISYKKQSAKGTENGRHSGRRSSKK